MIGSGAGSSRPEAFAVNRSLNYAQGSNNITTAKSDLMTTAPAIRNYKIQSDYLVQRISLFATT